MIAIAAPCREKGARAKAREVEIQRCLKMKPTYIFMMDDDQVMPIRGLNAMIGSGADVSIIDAPSKGLNDSNVKYHPDGTLAYTGISCCLIKAQIFKVLPKPWFSSEYEFREDGIKDGKIVWNVQKKYKDNNINEDIYFIRKVIDFGFDVQIIKNLKCNHYQL